jgi:Fe-S-cluster-containing dehydrogenase component
VSGLRWRKETAIPDEEDFSGSHALHRLPELRRRLPGMRHPQGRKHDLYRFHRAQQHSRDLADPVHALRRSARPCAQVCPAQAILASADGIVHQADETRCIGCQNCVFACPFGVPKFQVSQRYMRKCNMCYDRTSQGKGPMCATVCPTQAIFYGTYEEFVAAGRTQQGAKPVNRFQFGEQTVRRPPQGAYGPRPEPYEPGLPGRSAIVEGQVFVVAFIFIAQLWLVTVALYELLTGRTQPLGWLTLASFVGFAVALIVWRWPRRRLES